MRASFILVVLLACGGSKGDPFVVGPSGGTIEFDDGVVLEVPAGALSQNVRFEATLLDPDETQALLDESGNHPRSYISGVDIQPSGTALAMPITVTLPIQRTPSERGLPVHFGYDADDHAWYPSATPTDVSIDPEAGTVSLVLDTLSPHATAEVEEVIERLCMEEPCKCGRVTVDESARNYDFYDAAGEDCKAAEIRGTATYHECNDGAGLTESWLFVEHSEGCVPRLTLTPESEMTTVGESKPFQARVEYVGQPYPAAELAVRSLSSDVASVSTDGIVTGTDGLGTFDVMGVSDGTSTVTVRGSVLYRPREISINGMVQELEERTKTVFDRSTVSVGRTPQMSVAFGPGSEGDFLHPEESTTITAFVRDGSGAHLRNIAVSFEVSAGSIEIVEPRTTQFGPATARFTAPDEDGVVTVTATAEVVADDMRHMLRATDTVRVQSSPVETWTGTLRLEYGYEAPEFPQMPQLHGVLTTSFSLEYDPEATGDPPETNVTGAGVLVQSTATTVDGATHRNSGDSCDVTEYWSMVDERSVPVDILARVTEYPSTHLSISFPRSDGGLETVIYAETNERWVCDDGSNDDFLVTVLDDVYWDPAVAEFGDPHYDGVFCLPATACLYLEIPESGTTTITGTCSTLSDYCNYALTITRP